VSGLGLDLNLRLGPRVGGLGCLLDQFEPA
jgi:hypothetical protein